MATQDQSTQAETTSLYEPQEGFSEKARLRNERDFWKHLFDDLIENFPITVLTVDDDGQLSLERGPRGTY